MKRDKSSISNADSYSKIGAFWDVHDLADYWDQTENVKFEVDVQAEITYFAIDNELSAKLHDIAKKRGISANTLLNLWLQEKLLEQK